jgi:hypothetical protein
MTVSTDVPLRTGQTLASAMDHTRVVVLEPGSATSYPASGGVRLEAAPPRPCSTAGSPHSASGGPQAGGRYVDVVTDLELLCTCSGQAMLTYDGRPMQLVSRPPVPPRRTGRTRER